MFQQILNPTGNLWLTVVASLVPLLALLFMLAILRMTAWLATIIAGGVTILVGALIWHAPVGGMLHSYLYGGLTGFWVIDWITFWGLMIFNTLVLTGLFERFKNWMVHHATADIRIQTIMLAWAFGALLEGLVGFGYPWAVVVPILVGLGIADLDAIRVAALANNAPVSYGALGAPILGLAAVTGLPLMALSSSIGNIVAVLALLPPWVLIYLVSGWEGVAEAWPLAIVGSLSYIAGQWPVAHFLGPYLPDLAGALVSFWILFVFVKIWRPKTIRGFGGVPLTPAVVSAAEVEMYTSPRESFVIWLPLPRTDRRSGELDGALVASARDQLGQAFHRSDLVHHAKAGSFDVQLHAVRGRHLDSGFLHRDIPGAAAEGQPARGDFCQDVQADVGSAAGGVFHLRPGVHFRFHRNGQFAGLRPLQDWTVFSSCWRRCWDGLAWLSPAAIPPPTRCSAPFRR